MQIRLDQIHEEPFRWQESVTVTPAELERSEFVSLSPIDWQGEVSFVAPSYLLRAELRYRQTFACSRCLASVEEPIAADLELLITTHASTPEPGEVELEEEELGLVSLKDDVLDLRPLLLEQLQLNIPMRPLCREDCAGLCPNCGADLNRGPCGCKESEVDPRWQALESLRGRFGA